MARRKTTPLKPEPEITTDADAKEMTSEEEIAPWWSEERDKDLRDFVMKEGNDILQGAVSSMVKKFRAMNWVLEGPEGDEDDPQPGSVRYHQPILAESEFGEGWSTLLAGLRCWARFCTTTTPRTKGPLSS
jgi:hypothetical protein